MNHSSKAVYTRDRAAFVHCSSYRRNSNNEDFASIIYKIRRTKPALNARPIILLSNIRNMEEKLQTFSLFCKCIVIKNIRI